MEGLHNTQDGQANSQAVSYSHHDTFRRELVDVGGLAAPALLAGRTREEEQENRSGHAESQAQAIVEEPTVPEQQQPPQNKTKKTRNKKKYENRKLTALYTLFLKPECLQDLEEEFGDDGKNLQIE
ncbi:hypothetical protein SEMRO_638_G179500.1 [Seminavis robusta]|uniref:Uncharacterized protein n=1 Tax=Seminavis robusta TaxID=568900 RepID=A0A9N8E9C9_9STRA|nr:hypothetical protein SEMRO_638_G179500.1 [Seminavis robusta]|eukprot:Sro638_g179500.1 n/a (126) ;mRNA; r:2318-2695